MLFRLIAWLPTKIIRAALRGWFIELKQENEKMSTQLDALNAQLTAANAALAIIVPAVTALQNQPPADDLTAATASATALATGLQSLANQVTIQPAPVTPPTP